MQRSPQRFKSDSVSEIRGAAFLEIAWLVPLLKVQSTLEISDFFGSAQLLLQSRVHKRKSSFSLLYSSCSSAAVMAVSIDFGFQVTLTALDLIIM